MSAEPSRSFPHNALWRKLRRRYFLDRFALFGGLFALPPALCGIAWLLHGPLWQVLTFVFGLFWFLSCVFMTAMACLVLKHSRRGNLPNPEVRRTQLWMLFVNASMLVALLFGRVDLAFYGVFGLTALGGLVNSRASFGQKAWNLARALALCFAFAAHAVWLVVPLLFLQYLPLVRPKQALAEEIRSKPTRSEYVERSREACAAGGG